MSACNGKGECLKSCYCECYDEEIEEYYEVCVCGHRDHDGFCPSDCCKPIKCRGFKYCLTQIREKDLSPFWPRGICSDCCHRMGEHTYTNQVEYCNICMENKNMLLLKCNHKVCNDCWSDITKDGMSKCPFCRTWIDWSKYNNFIKAQLEKRQLI